MHVHSAAEKCIYYINDGQTRQALVESTQEKDLGVVVDNCLNFEAHIYSKIKTANKMIGVISRNFRYLDSSSFILLYKSMVRSQVEYAEAVWNPYKIKLIEAIEKVQRRATKKITRLRNMSYCERLHFLCLPTLVYRRLRGDLIETFKIINGFYDVEAVPWLQPTICSNTRGHSRKLFTMQSRTNLRKFSFTSRIIIVETWNALPQHVIDAESINSFKTRLDRVMHNQDIKNYRAKLDLQLLRTSANMKSC
jgi:ribonuclease P/MRP protein subunit RPP40